MAYQNRSVAGGRKPQLFYRNLANFLAFLVFSSQFPMMAYPRALESTGNRFLPSALEAIRQQDGAADEKDALPLEQGRPIKRELGGGQQHAYRLRLGADQFLKATVQQQGIDIVVQVWGPDGKQIMGLDSEKRLQGQEQASLVTETAGDYRLVVQAKRGRLAPGNYDIRIEELRVATENERELQIAHNLSSESVKLYEAGKYDEALLAIERALAIRERILEPSHRDVATALNNVAIIYRKKGEYAKAEPLFQRALAIFERSLGPEDPSVADTLDFLALLHWYKGDYAKAEPLYQRALAIRENVLEPEHSDIALSLARLATLYWSKGDYAKVEPLHQRALPILEKELGPEHPNVARTLLNLAILYFDRSDYVRAEPLYQRALNILEKALGPEHPDVAYPLNNLAVLYSERGDYEKAERFYQRALTIRERALGPEHPDVAYSLSNLADIYRCKGDYAKAELLHRRALPIWEKVLGPEHPDVAASLVSLALLYTDGGDYAKAEPLYQRALTIWEKELGPEHPRVVEPLNKLASIHRHRGENAKAELLYRRALAVSEEGLGPEHPDVADILNNLAVLYAAKGDLVQAIAFQSRANAVTERNLALNLATGSERQILAYLTLFSTQSDFTFWLHSQAAANDPQALELAFMTLLRQKGRGLDAMANTIATLRRRAAPQDQELFDRLAEARSQLAALIFKESGFANANTYRTRIKPLEEKIEDLEAELSARSAEFRVQSQPVTLSATQSALPVGGALVEFVTYTPQEPRTGKRQPPRYLVYLLTARGRPKWIDLGEIAPIDRAVDAWRQSLRENSVDVKQLGRVVDELVMRPVRSLLQPESGQIGHLLIAPDGSLNLIPFAALVDEENRYLIERYSISYLTSGRDLLRMQNRQPSKSTPLVVAHPLFGRMAKVIARESRHSSTLSNGASGASDQGEMQSDPTRIFFRPLPGTKGEALAIKTVLPEASLLMQQQATEAALKRTKAPRILHIATHGFFLSNQEDQKVETRNIPGNGPLRTFDLRLGKWTGQIENPLLRSGLALSGANEGKQGNNGDDDGLLTALEVAGLNLWGTKLVVLSACDTGLGEVKNGEGVQGLRRALVLAGSESQVISLWAVPDEWAKDVIIPYYKRLRRGEGRAEGLRQVQLRMLRSKDLSHPFYWAAFIQSGEWGNLEGRR
jgi:CHAT domain-containing protein/Tfp pilus assembly protein PilF